MKALLILSLLAATLAHAARGDYEEVHELQLDAAGLSQLWINAGAGTLYVTGQPGGTAIRVTARIIVPDMEEDDARELLERSLELNLEAKGARAVLTSELEKRGWFSRNNARVDLEVILPDGLELRIDDGSGEIEVRDMAGDVAIEDGSGSLRVHGVGGSLRIDDGSGAIRVGNVVGNVDIIDGSGSIDVQEVGGSVSVDDGSGSVDVRDVGQDFVMIDDGSGSVRMSGIRGNVEDRS